MALIYDFSNSENWELSWSGVKVAPDAPNESLNRYFPIEDFAIPVQFESPVLAIYMTSNTDPGRWVKGGYAKQKIQTGITGGGSPDAFSEAKFLRLREINRVVFEQITTSYAVVLSIPFWLRHIDVTIYEYTGQIIDTVEEKLIECCDVLETDISQVRQDLALSTTTILDAISSVQGGGSGDGQAELIQRQQVTVAYFTGLL